MLRLNKLCLYISTLRLGGAERVLYNLAEYFHSRGVKVVMVTTFKKTTEKEFPLSPGIKRILSEPTEEEFLGGKFALENVNTPDYAPGGDTSVSHAPSGGPLRRLKNFRCRMAKLRAIWTEEKPDLILSFVGKNNLMAILSASGTGIPVVVSVRGNPPNEYSSRFMKWAAGRWFPKAAGIVMQTPMQRDWFPERVRKKTVLLPNPLNPAFLREPLPYPRAHEIVTTSVMGANKNLAMLIRGFALCAGEHSDWKVIIYALGPEREMLTRLRDSLSLEDRVLMPGEKENIPELIASAAVFTMTSFTEGVPNALMEAMALGLACVSTDCPCGGPAELIQDEVNGMLVPVDDEQALAERLGRLMGDEKLRERLGKNALKIRERFSPEKVLAQWEEYLTGLIS